MKVEFPLGDMAEKALTAVGVTSERVERWLGRPCGCKGRKEKLNRFGAWVVKSLGLAEQAGTAMPLDEAAAELDRMIEEQK